MSTRKPAIPAITGVTDQRIAAVLAPLKESIEILTGARGGQLKTLPTTAGTNDVINKINQVIVRLNASGDGLTDSSITGSSGGSPPSGGTPGGSNTEIQFNDGGTFGGDPSFTWDKTLNILYLSAPASPAIGYLRTPTPSAADTGSAGLQIKVGDANGWASAGTLSIVGGNGGNNGLSGGAGGDVNITAGSGTMFAQGGSLYLAAGAGASASGGHVVVQPGSGSSAGDIRFNNSAASRISTLFNSGNWNFGSTTTDPSVRVQVEGQLKVAAANAAAFIGNITPQSTYSNLYGFLEVGKAANGLLGVTGTDDAVHLVTNYTVNNSNQSIAPRGTSAWLMNLGSGSADNVQFMRAPTGSPGRVPTFSTFFTLSAAGNASLLSGSYPSAWGSGYRSLEIGRLGNGIYASTTSPDAGLVSNLFWDGANWKYVASDEGSVLTLDGAGRLRYFTVPSGTAGNNATLTERFHVDNIGRAGVNVTPDGSGRAGSLTVGYAGSGLDGYSGGIDLRANTFYDGSNWKHANTGTTGLIQVSASSPPGFYAYGAVSASGGSNVTWTPILQVVKGYAISLEGASTYTGTGITFPATQSASSNANTIDDYEEGTWTPSSGTTNISVSTINNATYCKVGQLVYYYCYVELNNTTGAAASFIQINGLPFTNQAAAYPMAYPHYAGNGSQNASALYSYINSGSTTFYTSYTTSAIPTGTTGFMWTGVYRASA